MGFVEKMGPHSADKKKVVSARVSGAVVEALSDAENDVKALGYKFSISNIIDKALNDTLEELKEITGIDYYKFITWTNHMKATESLHSSTQYNFDQENEIFKDLVIATNGLDGQSDFDIKLKEYQDDIVLYWNNDLKKHGSNTVVNKDSLKVEYQPNPYTSTGYTVKTLSILLKKTPDEVVNILNNAGVTGKDADSHISTDDRQKLMSSLSGNFSDDINIKLK
jgi:hypothetical protein